MNNANDHETIGRSIVLSATPDEQNLFECNVKLVRKDTDWTIGLFIFSEGIYFVQQGSDKVIMIPIKDITNIRPGKPGAKQVKLQIKRSFKTKTGETKDVPYTFIFPEAQSNAQELMNKCRDVLVTLMFKRLKPEDRQKHFDNLTLEQKQKLTALNTDESLKRLHRQLVGGGTLTDDEFWSENMNALPRADSDQLQDGISPATTNPTPDSSGTNTISITFTPSVINSIFKLYPSVKHMYAETVPKKYTPEKFWEKYLQSQRIHERNAHLKSQPKQASSTEVDVYARARQEELKSYKRKLREKSKEIGNMYDLRSDKVDEYYAEDEPKQKNAQQSLFSKVNSQSGLFTDVSDTVLPVIRVKRNDSNASANEPDAIRQDEKPHKVPSNIGSHYRQLAVLDDLIVQKEPPRKKLSIDDGERYFQAYASVDTETYSKEKKAHEDDFIVNFTKALAQWEPRLELADKGGGVSATKDLSRIIRSYVQGPQQTIAGVDTIMFDYKESLQELLRHFWACMPCATAAAAKRATKIMARLGEMRNEFDTELAKRNPELRKVFAPLKESIRVAERSYEMAKTDSAVANDA